MCGSNAKKLIVLVCLAVVVVGCVWVQGAAGAAKYRRISVAEYVDKMKAGWIGQMAGVGWGGPARLSRKTRCPGGSRR